jgi:hypothetical protein
LLLPPPKNLNPSEEEQSWPLFLIPLPLPTKPVEVFVVVSSIQVEVLEEPITLKPIPLVLPEIRVGVEVTLIDSVIHALEVFRILDIVQKDTHVMERPNLQPIHLVGPIDTTSEQPIDITIEQHVDDLATRIKQVVIGD